MSGTNPEERGKLALPFWRRQWLKLVALMEDYPIPFIFLWVLLMVLAWVIFVPMGGAGHCMNELRRWKLEAVGGEYAIDKASGMYDTFLSFGKEPHDRFDAVTVGNALTPASPLREQLVTVVEKRGGRARLVILDPRIGEPDRPLAKRFDGLAAALGQSPSEFRARLWHAAAAALQLRGQLGERLDIHLLASPAEDAEAPYFAGSEWASAYNSEDSSKRMDVMVLDSAGNRGEDYGNMPARLYVSRGGNLKVMAIGKRFEKIWAQAVPVDDALRGDLLSTLQEPWRER